MHFHRIAGLAFVTFSAIEGSTMAKETDSLVLEGTWVMASAYEKSWPRLFGQFFRFVK
jgi:hypothetical protein